MNLEYLYTTKKTKKLVITPLYYYYYSCYLPPNEGFEISSLFKYIYNFFFKRSINQLMFKITFFANIYKNTMFWKPGKKLQKKHTKTHILYTYYK